MKSKKISGQMISQMSRQSLKSSSMRNIFVMITIGLAAALLMAIMMFAAGQREDNKRRLSHAQQVGYYNLTEEQVRALKTDERIAFQIQMKIGILSEMGSFSVTPYYVSELSDKIHIGELESGKLPERENEIAVQESMLKKMGISPEIGSQLTLNFYDGNSETFTVSGILKGSETAKQFAAFFSKDYADNGSQLKDMPYEVYAKLYAATTMRPDECKEAMYLVGKEAGIERKYVNPSKAFLESLSFNSQNVMIYGMVGLVILLACVLVIYGVFYLSVVGKVHQFGQLRTIGMTKKQMKKFVSQEGRRLFLYSAPVGILTGGIAGYFILPSGFSIVNTLFIALGVFGVIYLITILSVGGPAKKAASVSPMKALRYTPRESMKRTSNKKICRSLTPFGLGTMNFSKNRKKAAITMFSLALGGILFMVSATFISSFDKDNYARQRYFKNAEFDIYYSDAAIELNEKGMSGLQAKAPLNAEMIREISAIDGVKNIEEIKSFGIRFDFPIHDEYDNNDIVYPLTDEETKSMEKYIEEGTADYDRLISGDYVLVADNDTAEEIYGWRFNIGDKLTFRYFDGGKTAEREVTVLGVLNKQYIIDNNGLEGWFVMPEQAILSFISYDNLNSHLLISTDPEKEEAVGEVLLEIVEEKSELSIETLADRRVTYTQMANQQFTAIGGLAIFIVMFSILSMINTLITNIVTRKQELAMLESIGMEKGQIRKMLLSESLTLVFVTVGVALTIGTLCGYILCKGVYNAGAFYMAFKFPVVFAAAYAGLLIIVPLIITFISIKNFSKEALVERLRGMEC